MRYEPVKNSLNKFFAKPGMRRIFYSLLDLLLLRTWHVRKTLKDLRHTLPAEAHVLDAGCGLGQYLWRMARKNRKWRLTGIDINKEQVEENRNFFNRMKMSDRVTLKTADLSIYQGLEQYDFILSVDVMEHIEEDEKVFCNFFNSMKKDGILLISTPSDMGGSAVHDKDDTSFIEEHVRNGYSIMGITEKLTMAGFKDIKAKYTYGIPGKISWTLSMKYPIALLNISRIFFIILPLYYLIAFPFSLILNALDVHTTHKSGTGLLITAVKH